MTGLSGLRAVAAAICSLAGPDAASTTATVVAADGGLPGVRGRR
jgi:hypothetical protein